MFNPVDIAAYTSAMDDDDLEDAYNSGCAINGDPVPSQADVIAGVAENITSQLRERYRLTRPENLSNIASAVEAAMRNGASSDAVYGCFTGLPHQNTVHLDELFVPRLRQLSAA